MHNLKKAFISWVVGVGVSLGLLVTGVQAQSGSLEPPGSAVNGSGDPVATTQTQPSWDQDLPANERFKLVLNGEAVLDKNTGLVWEQSLQTTTHTWSSARFQCIGRGVGGQMGWRLPSIHELTSLVVPGDPAGRPDLPAGHPFSFSNVLTLNFWSATTNVELPTPHAWLVRFDDGRVLNINKTSTRGVWCVRGGGPLSEY